MTRQSHDDSARAWVDIDLGALQRNGAAIAARAGVPILPMIKADAYGLGALEVVRALRPLSPWAFGVATLTEGEALRAAGVGERILAFTPLLREDFPRAQAASLTPILHRAEDIAAWCSGGREFAWHLGIDTGMSRAGIRWDRIAEVRDAVRRCPPAGACTHFHSADLADGTRDVQERRFEEALAALPARPEVLHCENGPAVERRGNSPWSVVRPGVFLYGVSSGKPREIRAEPVVQLRACIVDLRTLEPGETVSYHGVYRASGTRRIATLALGYADGYRRCFSNRGAAIVRGRRVNVAGIVTMDMTMLDVTDVPCEIGDIATLIGGDGDVQLDVETVAGMGDLSPYELLTGLRMRLPRRYRSAPA